MCYCPKKRQFVGKQFDNENALDKVTAENVRRIIHTPNPEVDYCIGNVWLNLYIYASTQIFEPYMYYNN